MRVRVVRDVWNGWSLRNQYRFLPRRKRSHPEPEITVSKMVKPVAEIVAPPLHGSLSQTVNTEQAAKSKYPGLYYS